MTRTLAWIGALPVLLFLAPASGKADAAQPARKPNIVFLLADDLGWKDVGYHGSEIRTPHLDKLAAAGVRLNHFYVMPLCSPTRACLMTGRYPIRYGLQTGVVRPDAQYGLPLDERTLAAALRAAGYFTAIIGKWHLGDFQPDYLPTRRGFDHQYGLHVGMIDYYTHKRNGKVNWFRNDKLLEEEGYTTQLLAKEAVRLIDRHDFTRPLFLYVPFNAPHSPLQAPADYLAQYKDIKDAKRRSYAAMVACMDDAIGAIVAALAKRGVMDDTIIIFSSDNGGPLNFGANNGTLRAGKNSLYEGGVRVPAFVVWRGTLMGGGIVNEPLHMVDMYPTLLKRAGASLEQKLPLDGRDAWPTIAGGKPSPHEEILFNVEAHRGALRRGSWKLVVHGKLPGPADQLQMYKSVELFNLADDPGEQTNLAGKHPQIVRDLLGRLNGYARAAVPAKGAAGKQ
ncbi:MAG TPA: arylsulfatase [Gemmataceae bacterium]|nr:arylsulfatase [Gemmataceae bacterium]